MARKTAKTIVYHIPKCGGTWVKDAMREVGMPTKLCNSHAGKRIHGHGPGHAHPDVVSDYDKAGRFSICFVRHPLTWYRSFWCFRFNKPPRAFPAGGVWSKDYNTFVNNVLDLYPGGFLTWLYQLYLGEDLDKVDFIGRQENLADDLITALELAGEVFDRDTLRNKQPHPITVSPERLKRLAVLTSDTTERVLKLERWVLEQFYTGAA